MKNWLFAYICENKDAAQLRGNREAEQRLYFCYADSLIPLLSKSKIPRLLPSSVTAQLGLYRTWSETPKSGFLRTRLKCNNANTTIARFNVCEQHEKSCSVELIMKLV